MKVKVRVKFFSVHREVVGKKELEIELRGKTSINEVLKLLITDYPKIRKLMDSTIISLNHNNANGSELLKDGDEVALFPPVGGG
jgi:molybdopterin synthase catalytic subunit